MIDEGGVGAAKGRSKGDAPGIDGVVHVTTRRALRQGDVVGVKIERADPYELWGTAV
jgi:ribosomal protein S12 methylthiotransferase